MMALHHPVEGMEREGDRAVGALRDPTAVPAEHELRVTAPVEEKDRLLLFGEAIAQRIRQHRGEERLALLELCAQIHDLDLRQRAIADPVRHRDERVGLHDRLGGGEVALDRRSRAAEHQRRFAQPGTLHRQLLRIVARRLLLLIGGFVLLIHHDQPDIRYRRKDRGARPDHDPRLAALHAPPLVVPFALREFGVQHRDLLPEPPRKYVHDLRRQGDLRQEHDGAAACGKRAGDGVEIDLGLTARGHAEQQHRARFTAHNAFAQHRRGVRLTWRERWRDRAFRSRLRRCAADRQFGDDDQSLIHQPFERGRACLRLA